MRLTEAVNKFYRDGLAESTTRQYLASAKHFTDWASKHGLVPGGRLLAPTEEDLIFFATDQARAGLAPGTIRSRISAMSWFCTTCGFPDAAKNDAGKIKPRLARVLRGITRLKTKEKRTRLPITPSLLKEVLAVLRRANPAMNDDEAAAYTAAFTLALYALLRVSELAAPTTTT